MSDEISGYWISTTDEEAAVIERFLKEEDLPSGPEGIKQLLMEVIAEGEEDAEPVQRDAEPGPRHDRQQNLTRLQEEINRILQENPGLVDYYGRLGGAAIKTIMGKIKKKGER